MNKFKITKGFTFLELMIVIAIFSLIAFFTMPFSLSQIQGNKVESATREIPSAIFSQQENAFSRNNNVSYGIAFFTHQYKTFIGADLATGTNVEVFDLDNDVNLNSINFNDNKNEVVFASGNLSANNIGSLKISNDQTNFLLEINAEGLINYKKA